MRHAALVLALVAPAARAAGSGPEVGIQTGYAVPFGDISDNGHGTGDVFPLPSFVAGAVSLQADIAYRFIPYVAVGVYGAYRFDVANNCVASPQNSADCSAHGVRIGANVRLHPLGVVPVDPWVGIGAGYEWLRLGGGLGGLGSDVTFDGFEFANLQLGIDFEVAPRLKLGPLATLSLAQYRRESAKGGLPARSTTRSAMAGFCSASASRSCRRSRQVASPRSPC